MSELFKQTWWDKNLGNKRIFSEYLNWLGNETSNSREFIRDNIKELEIKSIADFGCGPALEYKALKSEGYDFEYIGIDSCVHIEDLSKENDIPFINVPVEETGLDDNSYELSYSRHVLEHLPTYKDALNEMIRVARKYVVHIFFIKPTDSEKIVYDDPNNLYHNRYVKEEIEDFINLNQKVESFEWVDIDEKEVALTLKIKE